MQNNPVENSEVQQIAGQRPGRGVAINIAGLSKAYAGREVLKAVNLQVAPGEFVAIVGRSGCGKSTLLRLIAKLETGNGDITFGKDGVQPYAPETRIMFQDSRLLPWKRVLNNVALGLPKAAAPSALQALRQVGLEERAGEWPAVLSGGQRQRVALARALVHDPELLLLDEPLGALDALTRIEMQQLIEGLWQRRGFTAVLVTHDVQEAIALADRVVLIEDGNITLDQQIDLPRPRARGNPRFAQIEEYILSRVLQHPASAPDSALGDVSLQRTVNQVQWAV
ncbi:ATP-binding cassette domain-containing protein [Herbaspirillum autotrophicum]|uniref:ATP-binding cassette domain-containing protein n=1 Tax=Herbaspirillum autotrophicum TaxID=180195 RepID=UPI00067AE043|nr:ATP-binding cassette domain-containing protein [Herbaspirillum autotrophicum]